MMFCAICGRVQHDANNFICLIKTPKTHMTSFASGQTGSNLSRSQSSRKGYSRRPKCLKYPLQIYWIGPLLGGAAGALVYDKILSARALSTTCKGGFCGSHDQTERSGTEAEIALA